VRKITPLLILLPIGILLLGLTSLYYLFIDNKGGQSLAGVMAALYALGVCAVLFAERVIVEQVKIQLKYTWIIELILVIVTGFIFAGKIL
jgi:hypothetical protein